MAPRSQLQTLLKSICPRVYFQPPPGFAMEYPCIVYRREPGSSRYADNKIYSFDQQYEVTLISGEPDEAIFEQLKWLPQTRHSASFTAENLYHSVFAIFF